MERFTEKNQVDLLLNHSTGSLTNIYAWPNVDMSGYDEAAFIISCPGLTMATATATGNEKWFSAAVYTATAATATALTAVSSATASFGSSDGPVINGAQALTVTFNTASVNTTYSICGVNFRVSATQHNSSYEVLGGTGLTNATYASALAACINSTSGTLYTKLIASTDIPVGATMLSSNAVYIRPRALGSTTLSATGFYGATANKGVLVAGDFQAVISVPTEKMGGARYITIGCASTGLATPFQVSLIRKNARFTPDNKGLAANIKIGSTTT
jgi:hypothetical protein